MKKFAKHIQTVEASLNVKLNTMKKYNVTIGDTRTSVTLEPLTWEILHDVAKAQGCSIHDLCGFIQSRKAENSGLSSAIRVFLLSYLYIHYKQE